MFQKRLFSKSQRVLCLITLVLILNAGNNWADEPKSPEDQKQPTVPALEKDTRIQVKESAKVLSLESTLDFLTPDSPIAPTSPSNPKQGDSEEVNFLISEECSGKNTSDGTYSCQRVYSNGHQATVLTQYSNEGDEKKRQTVIEEFDRDGALLYRKTIRYRLDYNYLQDKKTKEKELFDITYQPADKAATRELMVYEYSLETGKTRSLSWTQYKQAEKSGWASLTFHALLRYGSDGQPERALAESWNHGKKTETFMNWNRLATGYALWDKDSWEHWEGWIRNVSLQAYLP